MKKIKNSQPQTKFTGSYKKKSVIEIFTISWRKKHESKGQIRKIPLK